MFLALLILLFTAYIVSLVRTFKFSIKTTKVLKWICLGFLFILVAISVMSRGGVYLNSYYLPRFMFWVWLYLSVITTGLGARESLKKISWWLFRVIYLIPIFFCCLLIIPFFGAAVWLRLYAALVPDSSIVVYSDSRIRIEQEPLTLIGPPPSLDVYQKTVFFAYKLKRLNMYYIEKSDTLSVAAVGKDQYLIWHRTGQKTESFEIQLR